MISILCPVLSVTTAFLNAGFFLGFNSTIAPLLRGYIYNPDAHRVNMVNIFNRFLNFGARGIFSNLKDILAQRIQVVGFFGDYGSFDGKNIHDIIKLQINSSVVANPVAGCGNLISRLVCRVADSSQ